MADHIAMHEVEVAELAAQDRVKHLAAILEASPQSSKRRGENADQTNLERAEKMKPARNLDASFDQGTTGSTVNSFLHFTKEHVVENLESKLV
jgi:hypothetical protein